MSFLDKIKSWFASDQQFLADNWVSLKKAPEAAADTRQLDPNKIYFTVPSTLTAEGILEALVKYGKIEGFCQSDDVTSEVGNALMDSVKNQIIKMHEEILKYYQKNKQTPDDKMLNLLTVTNIFYLSMGSAILAKVKKSNLIAQGIFVKMLKKSGPELFYREVAAMAGHKYGSEEVERLHKHVQRAAYLLLVEADKAEDSRLLVIECARAMYLYALRVSIANVKK